MRDVFLVTVSDGTLLSCEVHWFGGRVAPRHERWSVCSRTTQYVGPLAMPDRSDRDPHELAALIEAWWGLKKQLGQVT